ncbi:MAG: nicotinate (nicotinamide) nucleotide adenylyltransferase [Flavobacteriales bacterium]
MRVGLYFGSFNPIHLGHIHIAQEARNQFMLDEVWLMVSPQNPFKETTELAHENDRLAMAHIACENTPHIRPSDVEFSMPKPSYTISTVEKLRADYPENTFFLIIGEDNLHSFHLWKDSEQLLKLLDVIVYPRASAAVVLPVELIGHKNCFHTLAGRLVPISATSIREKIYAGLQADDMLHPDVLKYIRQHHLYSS